MPQDGILPTYKQEVAGSSPALPTTQKALNSNPYAIPLFQSCNDPPRKVLALVLAAMSVKVHDLSPMTELDIHTAFSSAIARELRPPPLMRVIYRVGTHWCLPRRALRCSGIFLESERKPDEKPSRTGKVPPVRISPCGHDCHYRTAWSCAPRTRFLRATFR
jgi:hypothetical protein